MHKTCFLFVRKKANGTNATEALNYSWPSGCTLCISTVYGNRLSQFRKTLLKKLLFCSPQSTTNKLSDTCLDGWMVVCKQSKFCAVFKCVQQAEKVQGPYGKQKRREKKEIKKKEEEEEKVSVSYQSMEEGRSLTQGFRKKYNTKVFFLFVPLNFYVTLCFSSN